MLNHLKIITRPAIYIAIYIYIFRAEGVPGEEYLEGGQGQGQEGGEGGHYHLQNPLLWTPSPLPSLIPRHSCLNHISSPSGLYI